MNLIKLSILIPTYNYKLGLSKILESINCIDYDSRKKIEIIISDDSDNRIINQELKNNLTFSFKNFKYIHNKKTLGGPENWNQLISLAKGDYYWILHHDEVWQKDKVTSSHVQYSAIHSA